MVTAHEDLGEQAYIYITWEGKTLKKNENPKPEVASASSPFPPPPLPPAPLFSNFFLLHQDLDFCLEAATNG